MQGEANLTFDGSTLGVTGDVTLTNTSSNPQLALIAAANGTAEIQFGDANDAVRGNILYKSGTAGDALCFNGYNNTERLRITSDGLVHIGLAGMSGGDDQALTINNPAGDANVLELSTSNSSGKINLGRTLSSTLNTTSYIEWTEPGSQGTGELRFGTSAGSNSPTERLRITSDGNVKVNDGNLVIGTAGHGIDFSATSDGSGTDSSELFDDYEEGTFTPRLGGSNIGTYNITGGGSYTKIGRHVYIQIRFNNQDLDNNAADWVRIDGLPYTPAAGGESPTAYGCTRDFNMYKGSFNSGNMYSWNFQQDATLSGLYSRSGNSWVDWSVGDFHSSQFYMNLNGHYITAS